MAQNTEVSLKKRHVKSMLSVLFLIVALVAVIYAMRYSQSLQFQQGLAIMFGPAPAENRAWTWCPQDTSQITFYIKRASEDSITPEQICKITLEPVSVENANREFRRYLTVGTGVTSKTLETDEFLEVFRVDGLVFQSQTLSTILKGH